MATRKQNRCVDHNQQIVALCIDEACTQACKAVCPLELYNDHLDHKFQNISKIHSDWGLYARDAKEIGEQISRQNIIKYMDSIIDELMFKIKEHLFLVRKELDVKMGMYYTSKPVEKIRAALQGIGKCLQERFLQLRHEEIENSKFFIEVYGMKKLLNDTATQKQNFQKQILIAFAKIKEEMFMDYPKFNALVKAKEYEYCQIIKNQKIQIAVLKQKLQQVANGFDKITQEHKQLTYELGRTTNELKNKEAALAQTTDKLKVMTQKYNQQAEEAILKAREIKTKNIFSTYSPKFIYRVSDRIIKTGDAEMDWPNFAEIGQAKGKIFVKMSRFDVGGWVLLGVCFHNAIQRNQYEFDNYKTIGHAAYMLDNNRWCYSDTDEDFNCKPLGFSFHQYDIIKVEVFDKVIRFSKMAFGWEEEKFELPYQRRQNDEMVFCVAVKGQHTQVQLV